MNIIPPQEVIVIDDAYIQYLDDRHLSFSYVENIPKPEDCNLRFEEISGAFYLIDLPPVTSPLVKLDFVTKGYSPIRTEPSLSVLSGHWCITLTAADMYFGRYHGNHGSSFHH